MRSPDQSDDAQFLNDVFREKAFINGAKFVDTWSGFTDDSGRYSAYGPDMEGQVKRLRADDGVHFTMRGYLKLAHFVEKEMRHDLSLAKLERNIPLAGDAQEQAKMMGRAVNAGPTVTPPSAETPVPPVAEAPDSAVPRAMRPMPRRRPMRAGAAPAADAAAPAANPEQPAAPQEQAKAGDVELVRPGDPGDDARSRAKHDAARRRIFDAGKRNDLERSSRWLDRAFLDFICKRFVRFVKAKAAAHRTAILQSSDRGRAVEAEGGESRRFRLAEKLDLRALL